jgi:hypothetical protein
VSGLSILLIEVDDEHGCCGHEAGKLEKERGERRMFPAFMLRPGTQPCLDLSIRGFAHNQ